jgi:hypothetical protein
MWKAALAGAMLATTGVNLCLAQDFASNTSAQTEQRMPSVTGAHIARLKAALRLNADQLKHWPAVESALRRLSRKEASGNGSISGAVVHADAVRRVAAAARPLINALDDRQKQEGMQVIRALGFSSLASAL